jgi:hypothetical protein
MVISLCIIQKSQAFTCKKFIVKEIIGDKGDIEMGEQPKTISNSNMHAIILSVIGIILVIGGLYIINVHGAPLRGSGAGTAITVLGFIVLVIAFLRFYIKRSQ